MAYTLLDIPIPAEKEQQDAYYKAELRRISAELAERESQIKDILARLVALESA